MALKCPGAGLEIRPYRGGQSALRCREYRRQRLTLQMQFRVTLPAVSVLLQKGATLHGIAARTGDTKLHVPVRERNNVMLQFTVKLGPM